MEARNLCEEIADKRRYETAEDHGQERAKQREMEGDDDAHQEADNILDYAIEYCMTGSYPDETEDEKTSLAVL